MMLASYVCILVVTALNIDQAKYGREAYELYVPWF